VPGLLTDITEITTALGTLAPDLATGLSVRPPELRNVPDGVWDRLTAAYRSGQHRASFATAFANGVALLTAADGLRGRRPVLVEWKGPHRPPGDDVVPADLRIDHVYLVSCKHLSKVLLNAGPARLFDRLLVGEDRSAANWFAVTAPREFQDFYRGAREISGIADLPLDHHGLTSDQQRALRCAVSARSLPAALRPAWGALCRQVSRSSSERWQVALTSPKARIRLLWRLLRITNTTYFVLGADRAACLRLRVASTWDWNQAFELHALSVEPLPAGQPEVSWRADVRDVATGERREIRGRVEIRWSHGRFVGSPEAKVYLDTPHAEVAGYHPIS
jgi:hypothetical protein